MHKLIVAIIRDEKIEGVSSALRKEQIGFTYSNVKGFCNEVHLYKQDIDDRIRLEIVVQEKDIQKTKDIIMANACCGLQGDGCMSVYVLDEFITFSADADEALS